MNAFEFAFDDEVADAFFFNEEERMIKIYFSGCFSHEQNKYINKKCILSIHKWKDVYSGVSDNDKRRGLRGILGIINMIVFLDKIDNNLKLIVNTLDEKFIYIDFIGVSTTVDFI